MNQIIGQKPLNRKKHPELRRPRNPLPAGGGRTFKDGYRSRRALRFQMRLQDKHAYLVLKGLTGRAASVLERYGYKEKDAAPKVASIHQRMAQAALRVFQRS